VAVGDADVAVGDADVAVVDADVASQGTGARFMTARRCRRQ
jgi:hypothetical protein